MIGVYDYTVILTYVSLACSVFGMTCAIEGRFRIAICCLALSGLCDMFDGKIARTKKDRTAEEKLFGIQIDSLCDMVCFGVFPAMICYLLGVHGVLGVAILIYYCLCGLIRLAYFNVQEANGAQVDEEGNRYYHGLPITSMAVVLPIIFLLNFVFPQAVFHWLLHIALVVVGTLFVVDFKLKKPSNKVLAVLVIAVGVAVLAILLFSQYRIRRLRQNEEPLIGRAVQTSVVQDWILEKEQHGLY